MSKVTSKGVSIFLALDKNALVGYFNPHDPSPIYKRQLGIRFEHYIRQSVQSCKRYDPVFFKLTSTNKIDEQFADPLMYAVRGHFTQKRDEEVRAFARFKRKNYGTIGVSMIIVAFLNLILPLLMSKDLALRMGMTHFIDVFSFVIFYHPLTELLFNWNPHLKRINLFNKLIAAEAIVVGKTDNVLSGDEQFDEYEDLEESESVFRML